MGLNEYEIVKIAAEAGAKNVGLQRKRRRNENDKLAIWQGDGCDD